MDPKRVGGVRISTMSLANSLKSLGFDVEYIFGIKSIELLIKDFFIFNKKEYKKNSLLHGGFIISCLCQGKGY